MNKQKGSRSVSEVIEFVLAFSIFLNSIGTLFIKLAKADFIRRTNPNREKKNDYLEK